MKQTSIDKLSKIYNALNNTESQYLAELIQQVIRAEATPDAKKGKFDIFKYTANELFRPVMATVFHDEGFRVASDAHILVAVKEDYPEEYEQKMLHADGSFEEHGIYPKWRSVIPKPDGYRPYKIEPQKFYSWLTQVRAEYKAETGKGKKWCDNWFVRVGEAILKAEYFDKLLTAMERIGATELMVKEAKRSTYATTEAGTVLLMPVMGGESDKTLNMA